MPTPPDNAKIVLLTFDYEVFFKESGSFRRCMEEPVEELLAVMKKHGMAATFFVDVLYYFRLTEQEETRPTAIAMKRQMLRIVQAGSRIEPHLHPHWLDAKWENGNWKFPHYERYRLQSLGEDEVADLFRRSCAFLEEVAGEAQPGYKVMAYRAGGWCVQPFDKLRASFAENGILMDSSVAPRMKGASGAHYFDFSRVRPSDHYKFDADPASFDPEGALIEVPITTYRRSAFDKIRNKIVNRFMRRRLRPYGDGRGIPLDADFRKRWLETYEMVTLERMYPKKLARIVERSRRKAITVISHPKGLSRMSFECLEKLAEQPYRFLTLEQYYNERLLPIFVPEERKYSVSV